MRLKNYRGAFQGGKGATFIESGTTLLLDFISKQPQNSVIEKTISMFRICRSDEGWTKLVNKCYRVTRCVGRKAETTRVRQVF